MKGKTVSNLKCEFSKDSEKAAGTFTEENGEWICDLSSKLSGGLKSFNGSKYVDFVVKIFDGTELLETRTVKIKGL